MHHVHRGRRKSSQNSEQRNHRAAPKPVAHGASDATAAVSLGVPQHRDARLTHERKRRKTSDSIPLELFFVVLECGKAFAIDIEISMVTLSEGQREKDTHIYIYIYN